MTSFPWEMKRTGRRLSRHPFFSLAVILLLGIAIAANTSVFGVIDALFLRTLPVRSPQELQSLFTVDMEGKQRLFSYAMFTELRRSQTCFSALSAWADTMRLVETGSGNLEMAKVLAVSRNFYSILRG